MGSFIAVLLAIALCIAAYKVLKHRLADKAPSDSIGAGSGGERNPVPPAKS